MWPIVLLNIFKWDNKWVDIQSYWFEEAAASHTERKHFAGVYTKSSKEQLKMSAKRKCSYSSLERRKIRCVFLQHAYARKNNLHLNDEYHQLLRSEIIFWLLFFLQQTFSFRAGQCLLERSGLFCFFVFFGFFSGHIYISIFRFLYFKVIFILVA